MRDCMDRLIATGDYDIIFTDQTMEGYIDYNSTSKKILYLVDPLNYSLYQYLLNETIFAKKLAISIKIFLQRRYDLTKYKQFDGYIFPSQEHEILLQPYLNAARKSYVIPQGVDLDFFNPEYHSSESNAILFTGTMNYPPNVTAIHFFFDNIYAKIKKEIRDVILFIVGNNPTKDILKYQSNDVIVTGYVKDVREYFAKSAVVITPIVVDDGGYKVKVLEAMAMGKPCVSTSLGVKGLSVQDGENILIADNPEDFARATISLLRNKNRRHLIGTNARKHVEKYYSLENMCKRIRIAFQDINM